MIFSRNISEEKLLGNVSENATSKVILLPDGLLVSVGVVMLLENMISIILLWKSTRLLFQIRILSLNLAISDFLTGFFLALPNTLFYEKYHCDIKKYPCFLFVNVSLFIVTMMNLDRCFFFCVCHEILFVHHKKHYYDSVCFGLDFRDFSNVRNVF